MGLTTIVFGAADDEAAAAVLDLDGEPEGLFCSMTPYELWGLESLLAGVPASELPSAAYEPIADVDDFQMFVIRASPELGGLLSAAGPDGRRKAAEGWPVECEHLETWTSAEVLTTVEDLTRTLVEIRAAGQDPYMYFSI
jgi:hypothetical protein